MILLCGIPSDPALAMVSARLRDIGSRFVVFNQRAFAKSEVAYELADGVISGSLRFGEQEHLLGAFTGVYTRMMDDQRLPELGAQPPGSMSRTRCRNLHETIISWLEITPARVVNRGRPQASNSSKPYQSQLLLQHGFRIPETLITNDPELVREFIQVHGEVVYKSISGVRSIVKTIDRNDARRLDRIRWCPVQFQAFVNGINVRVHTIGSEVFATAIASAATDYRYAGQQGGSVGLSATRLSDDLATRCLQLAESLSLPFAGIDLKITPQGDVYCFEVNPSPAFTYYEANTDQPISLALARYLVGF